MAFELYVDVIPPEGGRIFVTHIFRGETEADAQEVFKQHAAKCEFLTPAIAEGRVREFSEEFDADDWPTDDDDEPEEDDDDDDDEPEEVIGG
jgi:hypothetical protein